MLYHPLEQVYPADSTVLPNSVEVLFDQTLVYQWVDGVATAVVKAVPTDYCPSTIEIWIDGKPAYGIHPTTHRVYLNALPFFEEGCPALEPVFTALAPRFTVTKMGSEEF